MWINEDIIEQFIPYLKTLAETMIGTFGAGFVVYICKKCICAITTKEDEDDPHCPGCGETMERIDFD